MGQSLIRFATGLAVALAILLGAEGLLRLLPLDRWEESRPNVSYPVFVRGSGETAGHYVTSRHFWGAMSEQRFALVKPPGVKRIFVLGGSAALGWPGPPPAAFTGYLQRALDIVAPGRYEVVNVAAMSYGSHRVADVLADVVQLEPDLVLIWSGNNEYVERNALPPLMRSETGRGLQRLLRHSALYRAVRLGLLKVAPELFARPSGVDITDPRSMPKVRRGMLGRTPEVDRQVLHNYRANLTAMARMLARAGVPGYFCTVPVNLADWRPTSSPPRFGEEGDAQRWEEIRQKAISAINEGRYHEARSELDKLLAIRPDFAVAYFLLGKSCLASGQGNEAAEAFEAACALDERPVRALPVFEEAIREVAAAEGVGLIDLAAVFRKASRTGVPGLDLFLDYVHPNEAGHKLAATAVVAALDRELALAGSSGHAAELIRQDDWLQRDTGSRADYAYALGLTLFNNGDLAGAEQAYLRALDENPGFPEPAGSLGLVYELRGDYGKALEFYGRAYRLDRGSVHVIPLARLLGIMGHAKEAREIAEEVYRQGVVDVGLFELLGELALLEDRPRNALKHYQEALAAGGNDPSLYLGLAEAYRRMGDAAKADEARHRAENEKR